MARGVLDRERLPPADVTPGAPGAWEGFTGRAMLPLVLLFVAWPFVMSGGRSPWYSLAVPLALLLALLGIGFLGRRQDAREIARAGFRACLRCRYDLRNLPPEGQCPECGRPYSHEHSERSWRWTYRLDEQA
jgi:hypothetical protein